MKRKKCWDCGSLMVEKFGKDPEGIPYSYWSCPNCGRKVLNMQQLKEIVEKEKKLGKAGCTKILKLFKHITFFSFVIFHLQHQMNFIKLHNLLSTASFKKLVYSYIFF
jgi:DNA-directed RNA polymerase subunit RPC12/RpoP